MSLRKSHLLHHHVEELVQKYEISVSPTFFRWRRILIDSPLIPPSPSALSTSLYDQLLRTYFALRWYTLFKLKTSYEYSFNTERSMVERSKDIRAECMA